MNLFAELAAENIFELQSEIARKIVEAIAVQLTPEEAKLLAQVPTQNLAAYEAYLRALQRDPNWDLIRNDPRFVELATPQNLIQ